MVKVTLKGVVTQAKGIDAVLGLSGGNLSLVVVGGGGRDLDQTLLTMPFSCVLLEPVPHHDTCIYLKVEMGTNSSAGACDTIVIILPSYVNLRKQRKRQQRKVGHEEEGSSSNCPELAVMMIAFIITLGEIM